MEYTTIDGIDLPASRIGLGTWTMGSTDRGRIDDDRCIRSISAALELGINFIDTAPAYGIGHAEEVVGRAIEAAGIRDQVIIATKFGVERRRGGYVRNSSRARIFEGAEQSLRRLRTDYIDVFQVHWPDVATPYEETAEALLALERAGKIRAIGASNYPIEALESFLEVAPLAVVQPPFNILERDPAGLIPWCRKRSIAAVTYGALCRGLLTDTPSEQTHPIAGDLEDTEPELDSPPFSQYLEVVRRLEPYARDRYGMSLIAFAVRWVLDQPGVSVALWGARAPEELALVPDVMSFRLDASDLVFTERVLRECVTDPVGSVFMTPPE